MKHRAWRAVAAMAAAACLSGCMYHVPLSKRLSPEKKAQGVAAEQEARRNGWDGVWDARIHSLHT